MSEMADIIGRGISYFDPKAYVLHPPAAEPQLASLERAARIHIPKPLRAFLTTHDGIGISGAAIFGTARILRANETIRRSSSPGWDRDYLQLSEDSMGNPRFLDLTSGRDGQHPVCLMQRATGRSCVIASGLPHFIFFFIEARRERLNSDGTWKQPQPPAPSWPRNEEYVTRHNPDILKWKDKGLPWEMDPASFPVD